MEDEKQYLIKKPSGYGKGEFFLKRTNNKQWVLTERPKSAYLFSSRADADDILNLFLDYDRSPKTGDWKVCEVKNFYKQLISGEIELTPLYLSKNTKALLKQVCAKFEMDDYEIINTAIHQHCISMMVDPKFVPFGS